MSILATSPVFDPHVAWPAIGSVVVGLVLAVAAWWARRRPVSVWLWTLSALGLAAGLTALILSVVVDLPREVTVYAAASAGLLAALVALLVAELLFSESRRPGFDLRHAVGRRAQVYQAVPGRGAGVGRVRVHAGGRSVLLSAVSAGPELPRYSFVRVRSGQPDGRVRVEPDAGAVTQKSRAPSGSVA